MDEWYCRMGGQDFGPMPFSQLYQAASAGQLPADAWVRFGPQDWIPITSMPQLAGFFQRAPVPAGGMGTHVVRRERGGSSTSVNIAANQVTPQQIPPPQGQVVLPQGQAVAPQGYAPPVAPQGVAVAPPPASVGSVPTGSAVPAIQPVVSKRPVPAKGSAKASPPPPGSHHDDLPKKKKKGNPLIPIYALGGTALGLVLVMVVVFVGFGGKKKKPVDENSVAAVTPPATPAGESNPSEANPPVNTTESNPAESNPPTKKNDSAKPTPVATTTTEKPPANESGKQAKELALFQKQSNWRDPRRVASLSVSKKFKIEFVQAWLASDANGKRVHLAAGGAPSEAAPATEVPATDAPGDTPDSSASSPAAGAEDASYLFVQFKITNSGAAPLAYTSWNGPSADTLAMLASDGSELVNFVPPSETKGVNRSTGTVTLAPQQSVVDTIVFAAPGSFSRLQLLLPQSALPMLDKKGYVGWELDQDYLAAASVEAPVATPPGGERPAVSPEPREDMPAAVNGGQPNSVDDLKRSLEGKPDPVMDKPAVKPGPPSIKDLDKQFQEAEEMEKKKKDGAVPAPPAVQP
jgi:hypothetical protein